MKRVSHIDELRESILLLEIKQVEEEALLREQFKLTYESLKPVNLIKSTLENLTDLPDLKASVIDTSVSLVAGFLSKKIMVGSSHNPFKEMFGSILQMGVTNLVSKNISNIKSLANQILGKKEIEVEPEYESEFESE